MPVDEVPGEEGGMGRKGGQGVCGFPSASILAPSLHLLPNLFSCQKPQGFVFSKICICAFILYPDHNGLCQAALCGLWFLELIILRKVLDLCVSVWERDSSSFCLINCHYLYIDTIVGVCKLSDFGFYPKKFGGFFFLRLRIGTESFKLFISHGNSLFQSFFCCFYIFLSFSQHLDRSMILYPFCVEKFYVNMRLSLCNCLEKRLYFQRNNYSIVHYVWAKYPNYDECFSWCELHVCG